MLLLLITLFILVLAAPDSLKRPHARQLTTFPSFAENIAVRYNGQMLVTSVSNPSVQFVDPAGPNVTTPLPPIPGANGLTGIVELEKDLFAVAAGIWGFTERRETNASVWIIDFRPAPPTCPTFTTIVDIPETTALNGFTTIPHSSIILGSDSAAGAIYAIDVARRTYSIVIQDEVLAPTAPAPALGVNGIKVHEFSLYFASSYTGLFGRFPIARTGKVTGSVQAISHFSNGSTASGVDDFAIDRDGNAYIAYHPNTIFKIDSRGRQEVVVSEDQIRDPTSVAFGRGGKGQHILYACVNRYESEIIGGIDEIEL